ncbi:MAG: hypothetical protein KGI60_02150 [Patescibacteria group bacterium]|nr:hypothetical protein [Patescibacteria group bacterium]
MRILLAAMLLFFGASAQCGEQWALQNKKAAVLVNANMTDDSQMYVPGSEDAEIAGALDFFFEYPTHATRVRYRGRMMMIRDVEVTLCSTRLDIGVNPVIARGHAMIAHFSAQSVDYEPISSSMVWGLVRKGSVKVEVSSAKDASWMMDYMSKSRKAYCAVPSS